LAGDLLGFKISFQLNRCLRIAVMFDGREQLIQFPGAPDRKAQQGIEHTDHMVMADDGGIFGTEVAEAVILLRLGATRIKPVILQSRLSRSMSM